MKILASILLLAAVLSVPHSASAKELVVALSPFQTPKEAQAQSKEVLQFLTSLDGGDKAGLLDGYVMGQS